MDLPQHSPPPPAWYRQQQALQAARATHACATALLATTRQTAAEAQEARASARLARRVTAAQAADVLVHVMHGASPDGWALAPSPPVAIRVIAGAGKVTHGPPELCPVMAEPDRDVRGRTVAPTEEDDQRSKALEAAKGWLAAERRQLQEAAFMPQSSSQTREAGGQQPTPLAGRYANPAN